MSNKINDGGPAFPAWELNGQGQQEMTCFGMTLRDYFAAKALPVAWSAYDEGYTGQPEFVERSIALHAFQIADEMLKAREK